MSASALRMSEAVADERLVVGEQDGDHSIPERVGARVRPNRPCGRPEIAAPESDALTHPNEPVATAASIARPDAVVAH
jgi:hypothetical protein